MVKALWQQSVAVVDQQAIFTDTSIEISSMEVAQCLQSVAVVDRQATFTSTSTKISCKCVWLSTKVSCKCVDRQATHTDTSTSK